jgi:hypothetical protein
VTGPASFEEFVRPLAVGSGPVPTEATPLSELPAGDYAVLAWLDDVLSHCRAAVEVDLVARWDAVSLGEVHAIVTAEHEGRAL